LWSIGEVGDTFERLSKNAKQRERIPGVIDATTGLEVTGWIGTLDEQRPVDEENTALTVLAWGKLVQEDLLSDIRAGGLYTKYLMGEIQANFVDSDKEADIATSDRQRLKETDPRYTALRDFVRTKLLRQIENRWGEWRSRDSLQTAMANPIIAEWHESLDGDGKKFAQDLFGRIGTFPKQDQKARNELYKYGVLGFEKLRFLKLLRRIDELGYDLGVDDLRGLVLSIDDLEAAEYHQIARGRLEVIERLAGLVDADVKEKVLQTVLFDHLWLLHPSWERASTNKRIEESVKKEFDRVDARLSVEERRARVDIRYRTAAGKHIIIELKRYGAKPTFTDLMAQLEKYRSALSKLLFTKFADSQPIEMIAILGGEPSGTDPVTAANALRAINARWITYDTLITEAQESYAEYLEANRRISKIADLIERLDEGS
jgi:hypothetical protein